MIAHVYLFISPSKITTTSAPSVSSAAPRTAAGRATAEAGRLLQEHWQAMYRDMETMRGMGWMWQGPMMGPGMMAGMMRGAPMPGPGQVKPLPDAGSAGAKLVSEYCAQCHATPSPTLHTGQEWAGVIGRMNVHMGGGMTGIRTPTEQQMQTILAYMQKNAR